jgi:1-acyl-sn-glycerol-3-phosphate acyltransferase
LRLSKNPLKTLYACYFGLWVLITFIVFLPGIYFTLSSPKRYRMAHIVRRVWGWVLLKVGFIFVKQVYEEPLDTSKTYIITPNHTSQLDIITLTVKLKLFFNFIAKAELEKVPVFGIWFRTIDIAVDRKDPRKGAESYRKGLRWLEQQNSMVIFPEGTISSQVPKLIKFKDGPFKMAIEKQVDILPVTIIGNWNILPDKGVFEGRPGVVYQYIHKPISTKGLNQNDVQKLKEKVYNIINSKLQEHGY